MTHNVARGYRAIIVGSGVAGLTTALSLGDCLVVTKTELGEGSSTWAQGGIAVAVADDSEFVIHGLVAGALQVMADVLVEEGRFAGGKGAEYGDDRPP